MLAAAATGKISKPRSNEAFPLPTSLKNIASHYDWLAPSLIEQARKPTDNAINKWASDIRIEVGYGDKLKPRLSPLEGLQSLLGINQVSLHDQFLSTNQSFIEQLSKDAKETVEALKGKLNIKVTFTEQPLKGTKNVHIIPSSSKKGAFKTNLVNIRSGGNNQKSYDFRNLMKLHGLNLISFAPESLDHVDGFLLVNTRNEIEQAFCFVAENPEPLAVKNMVRQCIVRSLGLPNVLTGHGTILSKKKHNGVNNTSYEITGKDITLINLLYSDTVQAGSAPAIINK